MSSRDIGGDAAAVPALPLGSGTAAAASAATAGTVLSASAAAAASSTAGAPAAAAAPSAPAAAAAVPAVAAAAKPAKKSFGASKKVAPPSAAELAAAAKAAALEAARRDAKEAAEDLPHQTMVRARLGDVAGRNAALQSSVASLHVALRSSEQDSADVLRYLEAEVRRKDILTKQLGKEIRALHASQVEEKGARHAAYTAEIRSMEQLFAAKEAELLDVNRLRHQELSDLQLFQRIRGQLVAELGHTKRTVLKNERRHALQMADLEKKFVSARARLLEESNARIEASRRSYKEEVGRELDLESRWIQGDNARMGHELAFHQALVEKLQVGNSELHELAGGLEAQVEELERKDATYASASLRNGKLVAELQGKHALLTASLQQVRADATAARKAKAAHKRLGAGSSGGDASDALVPVDPTEALLAPLHSELTKLQALSSLKSRENAALSRQIAVFRSAQNDVEAAAGHMIARVKREIVARRKASYAAQVAAHQRALSHVAQSMYQPRGNKALLMGGAGEAFAAGQAAPSVHISADPRCPPPAEPELRESRVTLSDFTLHDRERVLQLLFEQLNQSDANVAHQQQHQQHASGADSSRPSSALSLYTGGRRPGSSGAASSCTSLVVSRPQSGVASRPQSGTRARPAKPGSATRTRPLPSLAQQQQHPSPPPGVSAVDMRPSEYAQLSGLGAASSSASSGGGRSRAQQAAQRQHASKSRHRSGGGDEKEMSFFPPRGDTPTELL